MVRITFILGGARCGKSAYAEQLAAPCAAPKFYIATAEAQDTEMAARIETHRQRRGSGWTTLEVPLTLPETLADPAYGKALLLVDCLTLWLSNLMLRQQNVEQRIDALIAALHTSKARIILVSNEVGLGIVPDNALAREFRDHAGILHQRVAAASDRVLWLAAGIPVAIKG